MNSDVNVEVLNPETPFGAAIVLPSSIVVNVFDMETPFGGVQVETNFAGVIVDALNPETPFGAVEMKVPLTPSDIQVDVLNPESDFGGVQVFVPADIPVQVDFPVTIATEVQIPGPPGPQGPVGVRGSLWFTGSGPPGTIAGALPNDMYLDESTGNTYQFS